MKSLVQITAVRPESHSVDCIELRTGTPLAGVTMLTGEITGNTGRAEIAEPQDDRVVLGMMEIVDGVPFITHLLPPRVSQMLFDDGRAIRRHESDVYHSIDRDGNVEYYHPSGTFFRFAVSPDHEDLTAKNHDQNWIIDRNTDKRVHANLEVWNGGEMKAKLHIDPDGNLYQKLKGNLTQDIDGDVSQTIKGKVIEKVTGEVDITTPKATVHGDAEVTGDVTMAGGNGNCVTTESICAFLGTPHPDGSTRVTAGS